MRSWDWIEPQRGDWVVAVDAPLVVLNQTGRRQADADVSAKYWKFEAGAYPANLNNPNLGPTAKAGRLLCALLERGGKLVERAEDVNSGRLMFEMYPHPAMGSNCSHSNGPSSTRRGTLRRSGRDSASWLLRCMRISVRPKTGRDCALIQSWTTFLRSRGNH